MSTGERGHLLELDSCMLYSWTWGVIIPVQLERAGKKWLGGAQLERRN